MKVKRILAALVSSSLLLTGGITASANQVDFGGYTSGGYHGSVFIAARIGETSQGAYFAATGLNTTHIDDISAYHLITINSHLYVNSAPGLGHAIVDKLDNDYTYGTPMIGKQIKRSGVEWNLPPQNGSYRYSHVIADVTYTSEVYGSWSASGRMDY